MMLVMLLRNRLLSMTLLALIAASGPAWAQQELEHGKVGLAASLQGDQTEIMVPIWSGPTVVFAPAVRVIHVSDAVTDFGFGVLLRENLTKGKAVGYVGERGGILVRSPEEGDTTLDVVLGLAGGGEYFLSEHLSLGVEAQLNMTLSDEKSSRFGNPDGTNVNTATAAILSYYF